MKIRLTPMIVCASVVLTALPGMLTAAPAPEWRDVQPVAQQTEPLTFQFTGTVNAEQVGLRASEPFVMTYSFASNLTPQPTGTNSTSYAPLGTVVLQIARQCVRFTQPANDENLFSAISVFNDIEITSDRVFFEDSYDVRFGSGQSAPNVPRIFDREIDLARFVLVDERGRMLGDTSLPLSVEFAKAAQFYQIDVSLRSDPDEPRPSLSGSSNRFQLKEVKKTEKLPC